MADSIISSFVAEQKELLALEMQADEEASSTDDDTSRPNEERSSHVLGNLESSDVSVGLYGRTVVQLTVWSDTTSSASEKQLLPAHRLTVGDEVELRSKLKPQNGFPGGVVSEVSDTHIAVALFQRQRGGGPNSSTKDEKDETDDDGIGAPPFTLVPRSSAEVHRKLISALSSLDKHGVDHPIAGRVISAMFLPQPLPPPPQISGIKQSFNVQLDESQQDAIAFGLQSDRPFALIHGPPGTGKTTTVTELIQQAVNVHKLKVLVAAPSNVAVDNVLERLVAGTQPSSSSSSKKTRKSASTHKLRVVRLGHPARLKSSILPYSLEALVQSADGTEIVADVRKELQSYLRILANPKSRGNDKRVAYRELKSLRKEIRTREEKVVKELIDSAQVVLCTTVGAANRILDNVEGGFDLVVIDEAAQALEASCWIPILKGKRVVLAGDHCQLPPTIKSKHSRAQQGLGRTMFERLMHLYGDKDAVDGKPPQISRMLNVQYRMHEEIANWASAAMYHGQLKTHENVQKRTLSQLEGIHLTGNEDPSLLTVPLLLIDTAGCDMHELVNPAGSRYNPGEAILVARHVQTLIGTGLKAHQMCVITPYNGQCEYLRNLLLPDYPTLEIRSVDGFQGGEREAVILSLVRSSDRGGKDGIGFLRDDRRQNVAVTRAKRHLAVVCDTETVSQSKFIATLIAWMEEHGEQRSAVEYQTSVSSSPDEGDLEVAEAEILKLLAAPPPSNKALTTKAEKSPNMGAQARQGLMDKIAEFSKRATPGEEMVLSTSLTSYDRRLVHEFADQIGLSHRSEGAEGHDRRIILRMEHKRLDPLVVAPTGESEEAAQDAISNEKDDSPHITPLAAIPFGALAIDDSDSDEEETTETKTDASPSVGDVTTNSLLASLAKEREERQKAAVALTPATKKHPKKKKVKGQKLGGAKKPETKQEENLDDLDEMAFLDAQIDKAQNAHGRKVAGAGKGYRTIVNGILNARPEARAAPTNTRAAASLQSKLKEAQNGRKAKAPAKKKKK